MVRAAVDFLRGAWLFLAEDFFWLVEEDEALFFLLDDELLLFGFCAVEAALWADKPLLCSSSSAARRWAVNRLR